MVFIIDELDRCRPDFAIRLIERIKHFFDIPKIVFFLVMDKTQLSKVVCHNYGYDEIVGEEYLDKFIDFWVSLPAIMKLSIGKLTKITNHAKKVFLVNRCSHMPRIVSVPLSLEQRERLIFLAKHAKHWRERQRAQTILWLSEGKSVAEVATLQERIPETIRLQRRRWELYEFESIKEGHRSGRPNTLISDYQAKILDWVNTSPLNAEQIRVKLHEEYEVSVSVETIRKFLRDSGMVFKRTRHSLKKKRSDCI